MGYLALSPALDPYDHVLLDLDGCLWLGDRPTAQAVAAVAALRESGKNLMFCTNSPRRSAEDFVRKLWRLGFKASVDEIASVGAAVQHGLAQRRDGGSAFVIGPQPLVDHVAAAGLRVVNNTEFATRADVVVVSSHDAFDFRELRIATQAVLRGAELVGASRDPTYPMPDGPWPGSGSVLAAVEAASEQPAQWTAGKPAPDFYAAPLERLGPGRILAVGDRLDSDVAGAHAVGLDAALVLTGSCTRAEAAQADRPPEHIAESLADLVLRA